jgi:hypothetical protein
MEDTFRHFLGSGELAPMLEAFSAPFAGLYLYYHSRLTVEPKLRALIIIRRIAGHNRPAKEDWVFSGMWLP